MKLQFPAFPPLRKKFGGVYKNERGKTFIVVSGHVTFETVTSFLSDFHHEVSGS